MGHLLTVAKMRFENQEQRNTFWWGGDDAVHANAQDIIDEIADAYRDEWIDQCADTWELYAFDVYDKTIPGAPGIEYVPIGGAIVGASATAPMALQVATMVSFKASVPKPNTNRKFLSGMIEGAMDFGGVLSPGVVSAAEDWADRILDLPTITTLAVTLEVVELSTEDGTVVASNPLTFRRVTDNPSALRRRKIGVGI